MEASVELASAHTPWRLGWLTPGRCRAILLALLAFGFLSHLRFLANSCPFDLSGDEAHYWDWSRQLDWNYYSKGPLVAWIIRLSCSVLGDTMLAVRLPALVLAVFTALLTYSLTARLFKSEKLALGVVLLNHLVPMFIAGSLLMTIDPPFFFCWAAATYLAAVALMEDRPSFWLGVGLALGVGFLAKYSIGLWLIGLAIFFLIDRPARRHLRTPWPYLGLLLALLFTVPAIVWNAQHGWVTLKHVQTQTGADGVSLTPLNFAEFWGAQIGVLGPPLFLIVGGAVVWAMRRSSADPQQPTRACRFLLWIGVPFFAVVMLDSLFNKTQANWPAPAYFSLIILAGYFLSTRMRSDAAWRRWRGWVWATVALGVIVAPLVHNLDVLYPAAVRLGLRPRSVDPTTKFRGYAQLGDAVSEELAKLGPGAFVLCEDYQTTGEMAFYVRGQPKTYCAGPYMGARAKRLSQYDMWPDRDLGKPAQPALLGRDAIYVGHDVKAAELRGAFDRIEEGKAGELAIMVRGVTVRDFHWWRCYGFRGMDRPAEAKH